MFELSGSFVEKSKRPLVAHQVVALFTERATLEGIEEPILRPSQRWGPIAPDGRFALSLPDKKDLSDSLVLKLVAPDGKVLFSDEFVAADVAAELRPFSIDAKDPPPSLGRAELNDPAPGRHVRISGRVLDAAGERQVSNRQVVLYGRSEGASDDQFAPILAMCTDKQGYFSGEHPRRRFAAARAVVGVGERRPINIPLEAGELPLHPVLVVDVPETAQDEETPCRCGEIPRSPDNDDLTSAPGTYSSDRGLGRCTDFTVPNRTLEEFSFFAVVRTTEPVIQGTTLTEPKVPPQIIKDLPGSIFGRQPRGIDAGRAIKSALLKRLLADPDRLDRDSLRAAEKQTIIDDFIGAVNAVTKPAAGRDLLTAENPVDWDDEPTFYQATTIAHGHLLHLKQIWKADGYSLGDLLYSLPLAPCQKKQIAVIDWDRRETAARRELLEEEERLASMVSRDRDISEIVNATLNEQVRGGSRSTTWGIAGGYGEAGSAMIPLKGAIIQVGSVLGISGGAGGSAGGGWTRSSRDLASTMLQQLRDRTMQSASSSRSLRSTIVQTVEQGESMRVQTEVVANHNHCHAMTVEYFEVLRHFQVLQEIADVQECLFIPLLMSRFDSAKALRWREPLRGLLRDPSLRPGFDALERRKNNYRGSDLPTGRYSQEAVETLDGELRISFQLARPRDAADGTLDPGAWNLLASLVGSPSELFNLHLAGREQAERDRIFQANIAPRIAESFVKSLEFFLVNANGGYTQAHLDPTLVSRYAPNAPLYISLRPTAGLAPVSRESIVNLEVRTTHELPSDSKAIIRSGSVRYRTKYMNHFLFREARILDDLLPTNPVLIPTPLSRQELRNPREEDEELAYKLIAHLNEHLEYYHRAIWLSMDAERRFMLLDGFVAPTADGRSVASVVENRLVGIVGNCLVMPVALGFHLDPTFSQDVENPTDLLEHYAPTTPLPSMRISVPTRGVFAEAVLGACNSCEEKEEGRFWRFEESPCGDEPTAIHPVGTESRRAETGGLTPTSFPAPMINLQNAPAAPDPTGLTAALQLLGNANSFRDLSGLTETQRNSMAALTASLDAAKFFSAEAAKLAQQKALSQDIGKILQSTQKAQTDGLIDREQASEIATGALRGLAGEERSTDKKLTDEPEVKRLIDNASARGNADVSLSRGIETVVVTSSRARALGSQILFQLSASVGQGGVNDPDDVRKLKGRLHQLGFDWIPLNASIDSITMTAIKLFQAITRGRCRVQEPQHTGLVNVADNAYLWLQAVNAPRWQMMPEVGRGFYNYQILEAGPDDEHDWGTDWMAMTIAGAGAAYRLNYRLAHSTAALLSINDVSLPHGGETTDHAGHQTGLDCDCRLPRKSGELTLPGIAWHEDGSTNLHSEYDQAAAQAMIEAIRSQPLVHIVRFNDPALIAANLCVGDPSTTCIGTQTLPDEHDDHIHFEIRPPARGPIELIDVRENVVLA